MKFIHLSDLHLGKRLYEYSLIEDQAYILKEILQTVRDEKPDGVIIAGDVYDKPVPSAGAVSLFDDFLFGLSELKTKVFIISGNHDSPERIAFGSRIMNAGGIYLSPVYDGNVEPIRLSDGYGELNVYMLPFIKPANVREFFENEDIATYEDAVSKAIDCMQIDGHKRNILITHQFVTGAVRSESEEISVGGTDNIGARVFERFDYVALGHLHSPQNCGTEKIRYCGTPLKYSFSEAADTKSVTVAELAEKGSLSVRTVDLVPMYDMAEIRGSYDDITLRSYYENTGLQDKYLHITLTDEDDIPDAIGKLRTIYRRIMKLDYDNARTRSSATVSACEDVEHKSPYELFSDFYELQNNQPMSEKQSELIRGLIAKIWGDDR